MSSAHIKDLTIVNDLHVLVSIKCSKKAKKNLSYLNPGSKDSFNILSGESFCFNLNDFDLQEDESFSITITEVLSGTQTTKQYTLNSFSFKYSNFSSASAVIFTSRDTATINESETDYTNNHIRYVEVKNRTGGGYTVKIKVCYTKPGENEKTYETGRFPIAQSKKVDLINGLNLPTGTKVRIEVVLCSSGKSNAKGSEIFYVHELSNRNAYYELLATWGKTKDLDFKGYK